jgi:hypothetical protein
MTPWLLSKCAAVLLFDMCQVPCLWASLHASVIVIAVFKRGSHGGQSMHICIDAISMLSIPNLEDDEEEEEKEEPDSNHIPEDIGHNCRRSG